MILVFKFLFVISKNRYTYLLKNGKDEDSLSSPRQKFQIDALPNRQQGHHTQAGHPKIMGFLVIFPMISKMRIVHRSSVIP